MKKFFAKLASLKPTRRKIIQLYTALLFNANIKGFVTGNIYQGNTKQMCVPGLNCYSCPGAVGACPLGSLQGSFSAGKSTIFYVFGIIALYGLTLGRMICGWLCPFGLIQELLYKIKTPKLKKSFVTRILSFLKYVILIFFVFIVPITYAFRDTPLPAFCKYICPAGTLEGGLGLLSNKVNESYFSMLGPLFTWKFLLLVSIVVACIFIFRMFCRFICPLGALYGLFNKISFFGVKLNTDKCVGCNKCINKCKMDIKHVGDFECISCGECMSECPTGAISWKGIKAKPKDAIPADDVKGHKTARRITRAVSAVLLVAMLVTAVVYYWNESDTSSVSTQETRYGNQVGDNCYGCDLNIITSDGITADTINPIETGKITIINFWGTWCTPCVNELPYFDQIATNYKDSVSVIAVHTDSLCETAPPYINDHYPDSEITFACDTENAGYYTTLGGRGTYPYTVVIDENGVVSHIFFEALEYEDLQEAVEANLTDTQQTDTQ